MSGVECDFACLHKATLISLSVGHSPWLVKRTLMKFCCILYTMFTFLSSSKPVLQFYLLQRPRNKIWKDYKATLLSNLSFNRYLEQSVSPESGTLGDHPWCKDKPVSCDHATYWAQRQCQNPHSSNTLPDIFPKFRGTSTWQAKSSIVGIMRN